MPPSRRSQPAAKESPSASVPTAEETKPSETVEKVQKKEDSADAEEEEEWEKLVDGNPNPVDNKTMEEVNLLRT